MISKYSFNCIRCKKHFEIKGHWYNQMLMEWWLDFKWICHCIVHHSDKWNRKDKIFFLKTIAVFPSLLIMQILDIIAAPFRLL